MSGKADYQLRTYVLSAYSTSVGGSPQTTYIPVPYDGNITESYVTIYAAITSANSTITLAVLPGGVAANAVNVTTTLVVVQSGSAAGQIFMAKHSSPNVVRKGDVIRLTPSGASTTAAGLYVLRVRR